MCADEQIHSEEAKALRDLAQNAKMGTRTIEEMEKILSQDENLISVEDAARQVPPGQQSEAIRQILAIAYVDAYFSPLERELLDQVTEIWNWSNTEIQKLLEEANNDEFTAIRRKIRDELKEYKENGVITVAFVGQYNAGKSTTISALTGRRDIFQSIAKDLENQIHSQLWEFEQQVYGEIDKQIAAARQQEESAIAASNTWVRQLAEIRKDFESILSYISKATENPVA